MNSYTDNKQIKYKINIPKYDKRFIYYKRIEKDGIYYYRYSRWYWKPATWLSILLRRFVKTNGGGFQWWIRKHLSYD